MPVRGVFFQVDLGLIWYNVLVHVSFDWNFTALDGAEGKLGWGGRNARSPAMMACLPGVEGGGWGVGRAPVIAPLRRCVVSSLLLASHLSFVPRRRQPRARSPEPEPPSPNLRSHPSPPPPAVASRFPFPDRRRPTPIDAHPSRRVGFNVFDVRPTTSLCPASPSLEILIHDLARLSLCPMRN